jgi:hypothetical protein
MKAGEKAKGLALTAFRVGFAGLMVNLPTQRKRTSRDAHIKSTNVT